MNIQNTFQRVFYQVKQHVTTYWKKSSTVAFMAIFRNIQFGYFQTAYFLFLFHILYAK